jgi:hypothetical protein
MPEGGPNTSPVIAMAMFASAIALVVVAGLIYAGVVPMAPEMRFLVSLVIGAAGFADFLVALWFFRKSQSS